MTAKLMTQQPAFRDLEREYAVVLRMAKKHSKNGITGTVSFDTMHEYHMQVASTFKVACEVIEELQERIAVLERRSENSLGLRG